MVAKYKRNDPDKRITCSSLPKLREVINIADRQILILIIVILITTIFYYILVILGSILKSIAHLTEAAYK